MIRYTNEFLTDGDITIERVANRLKLISEGIKNSNKLNLCDINVICEEIFGKILNTLYGYELVTIGAIEHRDCLSGNVCLCGVYLVFILKIENTISGTHRCFATHFHSVIYQHN